MHLRPELPADFAAIDEVHRLAFGQPDEARLVQALRATDAYIPELALVAVLDDCVVGHILFTRIVIEAADDKAAAIALAPLAVLPRWQRAGIGAALTRLGLSEASRLGHRLAIVLGHADYYPRFGFVAARAHGIEAPFPVPDDAWMVRELQPGALRGVHGTVRYSAPFGAL